MLKFELKNWAIFVLFIAVSYGISIHLYRYYHFKNYTSYTVGKVISIEYQNVSTYVDYKFYINNKEYIGSTKTSEVNEYWVDKYFKVKYSHEDPRMNEILLKKWEGDTLAIRAAGFNLKN